MARWNSTPHAELEEGKVARELGEGGGRADCARPGKPGDYQVMKAKRSFKKEVAVLQHPICRGLRIKKCPLAHWRLLVTFVGVWPQETDRTGLRGNGRRLRIRATMLRHKAMIGKPGS